MTIELDPLPREVLRALDLERCRPAAPEEQLARLASRLENTFALPDPPSPSSPAGPGTGAAAQGLTAGLGGKVVLLAVGLAVGGVTGAQLQARFGAPREVFIARRIEVPAPTPAPPPRIDGVQLPAGPQTVLPEPPATRIVRPRSPKTEGASVEVERLLIEQATAALSRGNAAQALQACTQHEAQFHAGQLSEERESLAIRALLRLGRHDEALSRAAAFRARYPDGLLLDVVENALDEAGR